MTMRPLGPADTRRVDLDAAGPAGRWADMDRPEDVAALRTLAGAMLGDINRKRLWQVAWKIASRAAYVGFYKPFGHYIADSDHLARLVGCDHLAPADMAALQRLYTLSHAGCSSVMAWDAAAGRMVHFRSLDWPSAPAIAHATRHCSMQRGGREVYAAAGILGMVGLLTAVKPGFSVCINFAPWRGPSCAPGLDPSFLVRRLMDSPVTSYAEARAVIAGWRPAAPVFISLCGVEKGEATIFEFGAAWHGAGRCHVVEMDERDWLIQTNHYSARSPYAAHAVVQAPQLAWGDDGWDDFSIRATSMARHALIEEGLQDGADFATLYAIRPVWNGQTAQWVAMVPATGALTVWGRDGDGPARGE